MDTAPNLDSIPYDLLHAICRLLRGQDIAQLFAVCNALRIYSRDESIWHEVCARCGAGDPGLFDGCPWYDVYTILLHKYHSLLGHWASDHPFKGSVIEFRLSPEAKGIVGEVWRLWADPMFDWGGKTATVDIPEYFTFVVLSLPPLDSPSADAVIRWYEDDQDEFGNSFDWVKAAIDSVRAPTLQVLTPTDESMHYSDHDDGTTCVPEFPASPDPLESWYDHSRGLPRLPQAPSPPSLPQEELTIPWNAIGKVSMAPTDKRKPSALVFRPPHGEPELFRPHEARLLSHVADMRNAGRGPDDASFCRRFYPLRCPYPLTPHVACQAPFTLDPATLEGIWLASYTVRGTEVLYLDYDATGHSVRGTKITGNLEVPRGVVSWSFDLRAEVALAELTDEMRTHVARYLLKLPGAVGEDDVRVFRAKTTSGHSGFIDGEISDASDYAIVLGRDNLLVTWTALGLSYTSFVQRYPRRELEKEAERGSPLWRFPPGARPVSEDDMRTQVGHDGVLL